MIALGEVGENFLTNDEGYNKTARGSEEDETVQPFHKTFYRKGSFPHDVAVRIAKEVKNGADKAPLKLIESRCWTADEQFQALRFFYKCVARESGDEEAVKAMGGHQYKVLTENEKNEIVRLRLMGKTQEAIAEAVGRHISTVHYFLVRVGQHSPRKTPRKKI